MAQETKTITLRLPVEMAAWIEQRGEGAGINNGVKNVVKALMAKERYADMMLKCQFSPEEWRVMADTLNGTIIMDEFRFNKSALAMEIQDGQNLNGICDKWGADCTTLCNKIAQLSPFEVDAVYRRVENFWQMDSIDIEEWSKF